jgi:hypothetical protein
VNPPSTASAGLRDSSATPGLPEGVRADLLATAKTCAGQGEARRLSSANRRKVRKQVTVRLRTLDEVLDPANRERWEVERDRLRAWFARQPARRPGKLRTKSL